MLCVSIIVERFRPGSGKANGTEFHCVRVTLNRTVLDELRCRTPTFSVVENMDQMALLKHYAQIDITFFN
jgi:hypothetical protein